MTKDNIEDYIGPAKYQSRKFYDIMPPGVVVGLAYSQRGGSILYIESSKSNNAAPSASDDEASKSGRIGQLKVTGQLGSVMQESSSIALTYARTFLAKQLPEQNAAQ